MIPYRDTYSRLRIMPDKIETVVQVPVFRFEIFDRATRAWSAVSYMATQNHIDAFGGVPLPSTRRWVAQAEVDAAGIYRPALEEV